MSQIYTPEQIASALDFAVLKPTASRQDVAAACLLASKHNFASVCVRPCDVLFASRLNANVTISTVIGFPHGCTTTTSKLDEAIDAQLDGAKELDVVINYARLLEGQSQYVYEELRRLRQEVSPRVVLKAILETCYLPEEKIKLGCLLAHDAGFDYVKTSTGFGPRGASAQDIVWMKEALADTTVKLKASGGIQSYSDVATYLSLGCSRLGSSKWTELLYEQTR